MSQIVWLASYPKSGNTWLRAFLANYRCEGGQSADINALELVPIASRRDLFDEATGIESSDLTPDEIDCYRPAVYRQMAAKTLQILLLKIHDAYTFTDRGEPIVPADVSRGAIYILRNPLDVAVSFSYHSRISIDQTIQCMADRTFAFADSVCRLPRQLRQKLLSWSGHVLSWVEQTNLSVQLIRYEDLLAFPAQVFSAAVRFIGWEEDPARIARAEQFASFENLQAQEHYHGFQERPPGMKSFFRKGKAGSWRTELNEEQVARIIQEHGTVMRRFGYLSETGEVLS
jgi:aryl sulfotransferase